jgi:hypothetical protein
MKLNRRNVLIGLATATVGGGAAFGSEAFSTVEADRTVSVSATGDGSALLEMDITGDLSGSNGDTIKFDLGNDVNLDATTTFTGALTIKNNGNNSVSLDITDGSGNSLIGSGSSSDMDIIPQNQSAPVSIDGGSSETFDIEFDLVGTTSAGNEDIPGSVTIVANDNS